MNGYVAFWGSRRVEVLADTLYQAKEKAVAEFGKGSSRKKVKSHDVTVMLAEVNGVPVVHTPDF